MSHAITADPFKDGSSFFGFMGVTVALILASISLVIQISELHMELPKPAQVSAASPSGDPLSSWSHSSPLSWPVSSVSMAWSSPSFWVKKVSLKLNSVKKDGMYTYHDGYKHMASGLVCGFSCVVIICTKLGRRVRHWYRWRRRNQSQRPTVKIVCRTDFDIDFRRSLGIVRIDRFTYLGLMSLSLYLQFPSLFYFVWNSYQNWFRLFYWWLKKWEFK